MARFFVEQARGRGDEENSWRVADSAAPGNPTVRVRVGRGVQALSELNRHQAEVWRDAFNEDPGNVV